MIIYVGTYTRSNSKGIYSFELSDEGELKEIDTTSDLENPTFLAITSNANFLYSLHSSEINGETRGAVKAFKIDPHTHTLAFINEVYTSSGSLCHITLDHKEKVIIVTAYTDGTLSTFPLNSDGSLGEESSFIKHDGKSIHPRQESAHAHSCFLSPDNRFAFVCDLGMDKVLAYSLDTESAELSPKAEFDIEIKAGSGPRHLKFHPNKKSLYVLHELSSTIDVFDYKLEDAQTEHIQTISTLPEEFEGESITAEIVIHPNGKYLYASNRGHDSIAHFSIDPENGKLHFKQTYSAAGKHPRNFNIDPSGKLLLVANRDTDNITSFLIEAETGKLKATGHETKVPMPVCVIWK